MKTIADLAALPDLDKIIHLETQPAMQLNEQTWTQDGGNDDWYYDIPTAVAQYGEIVKVEEGGVVYDEEFSAAACHANASSFYYNDLAQRLYVHTSGSDDPASATNGTPDYCLVAFFWKGFANKPKIVERFDQLIDNYIFNFWDSATEPEDATEVIAGGSTITRDTYVVDDNLELYSAKITIDGVPNAAGFYFTVSTKPGRKCKVKIRYKAPVESGYVIIQDSGSNVYLNASAQWQAGATLAITLANTTTSAELEIEFVAHASYSSYRIYPRSGTANAEIYISKLEFLRYRQPVYYKPLLPSTLPSIQQSVGSYIFPENQISIGEMAIINDGWYWDLRPGDVYLWHNKRMICKGGSDSWDYEDMPTFFFGLMREPRSDIQEVRLAGYDDRLNLKTIPTTRFLVGTYANCDPTWLEKPIPVLLGGVGNGHILKPPEIDTTIFKYKITETTFLGITYPIHAISNVWKAGALLTGGGVDYTADLNNGEFTLDADPGTDEITCNAQSLKGISPFVATLSMLPAEFMYFILVILNGVDKHRLNLASFKDLYDNRVIGAQEYITDEDSIDVINRLQITAIFQLFTRLDGMIEARRYRSDVPTDVLRLYTRDFIDWEIADDTNHTYRELVIQNKPNFATGIRAEIHEDNAGTLEFDPEKIEWEHNIKDRLTLETNLETDVQTKDLFDNYNNIMEDPIRILKGTVKNHGALLLNPTDKIKVTIKANYNGTEKTIYDNQTFQIYHLSKDLNTGNTYFEAFIGWGALFWTIT